MEDDGVLVCNHFGAQFDFHCAPVAGVGDEMPDHRRTGFKGSEILEVERREKAIGGTRIMAIGRREIRSMLYENVDQRNEPKNIKPNH